LETTMMDNGRRQLFIISNSCRPKQTMEVRL